jgi:predicted transcriptional regulator
MSQITITVPDEVYERVQREAVAEGKTIDELAEEAFNRLLAKKFLERNDREATIRRGNKTEEECDEIVDRAVREYRQSKRGR